MSGTGQNCELRVRQKMEQRRKVRDGQTTSRLCRRRHATAPAAAVPRDHGFGSIHPQTVDRRVSSLLEYAGVHGGETTILQ
jgi:hypothetical protein